ncbi:hypothetical protein ACIGT4_30110 [Streptomyces sioyaensis]|uniref:hypothetical protein n=1 Tax=Streptomyces sioyaensis TaxID=67364 RepID=UPI0037CE9D05
MPALHRCGRRTDVLSVFGHLGGELVERFGPDPSGEPRRPERAILEHAPGPGGAGARFREGEPKGARAGRGAATSSHSRRHVGRTPPTPVTLRP